MLPPPELPKHSIDKANAGGDCNKRLLMGAIRMLQQEIAETSQGVLGGVMGGEGG